MKKRLNNELLQDKDPNSLILYNFKLELKNYPLLTKEINAKFLNLRFFYLPEKCYIRKKNQANMFNGKYIL